MPRWILPLPPSVNDMHGLGMDRRGKVHKYSKAEYSHWLAAIPALIGHWRPPPRTPLRVHIVIQVPANHLWSFDADNLIKPLIDGVLGHRKDNWVQGGTWEKEVGDWWAIVTVEPSMRASEPIGEEKSHAHHR